MRFGKLGTSFRFSRFSLFLFNPNRSASCWKLCGCGGIVNSPPSRPLWKYYVFVWPDRCVKADLFFPCPRRCQWWQMLSCGFLTGRGRLAAGVDRYLMSVFLCLSRNDSYSNIPEYVERTLWRFLCIRLGWNERKHIEKAMRKIEAAVCGITLLYVFSTIGTIYVYYG